ncbi:hypothetical protein J8J40_33705, partial [Mycobacterium tuberculosis]|nr:hypothetical protein [Mycobacterium tuberculosis]
GETYRWRGTPWGRTDIGARGVVAVFNRLEDRIIPSTVARSRHAVLEHVHIPVVVLQPGSGEISFANTAARSAFHLKDDGR